MVLTKQKLDDYVTCIADELENTIDNVLMRMLSSYKGHFITITFVNKQTLTSFEIIDNEHAEVYMTEDYYRMLESVLDLLKVRYQQAGYTMFVQYNMLSLHLPVDFLAEV